MNLKSTILCAILCVLVAAAMFCAGMHHAIRHMEIEPNAANDTALVVLHDQVYIYDIEKGDANHG